MSGYALMLFGSRATGESRPDSDVDVVISNMWNDVPTFTEEELATIVERLRPLAIENGGKLDLFIDGGVDFHAAYDDLQQRRIWLGSAKHGQFEWQHIGETARNISVSEIETLCMATAKVVAFAPRDRVKEQFPATKAA